MFVKICLKKCSNFYFKKFHILSNFPFKNYFKFCLQKTFLIFVPFSQKINKTAPQKLPEKYHTSATFLTKTSQKAPKSPTNSKFKFPALLSHQNKKKRNISLF